MKTSKIERTIPCPELRGSLAGMQYPAIAEVKMDGEFCFVHVNDKNIGSFTVNKYGKVRQDFKQLNNLTERVEKAGHETATFLAELHYGGGENGALYELLKNKDSDDLYLYIFDILEHDGIDLRNRELMERKEIMLIMLGRNNVAPTKFVADETDVKLFFEFAKLHGYEGIVVKSLKSKIILGICDWVKVKSKDRTDYIVHKIDPTQERIEILAPIPPTPSGKNPSYIIVGIKAINKYKKFIKPGDQVTIEHQGVLPSGSLRHPVLIPKPEWK